MASVTIGGYTYTVNANNSVTVQGNGMRLSGNNLGDLSTLSAESFITVAETGILTPEAAAAMRLVASSGEWRQIKDALTNPPSTNADPAVTQQEEDPANEEQQTKQQNKEFIDTGGDDEDRGQTTTTAQTKAAQTEQNKPGKRIKNPLGYFASYTYNISLYMITPDAYDAFVASGRRNVYALRDAGGGASNNPTGQGGGTYLICQSGGINNNTEARAEGFDLDYYIDNLKIVSNTNGKETQTSTNTSNMYFKIVEPYGFSFISNLKRAADELQRQSKTLNYNELDNPSRQFFILGIRFYGYDANGNIITPGQQFEGGPIDPGKSLNGVFERFYDINIAKINFKIEGKATAYNIEATPLAPTTAFNIKRGRVDTITKITANTVEEAISEKYENSLLGKINLEQQKAVDAGKITYPNLYRVRWEGSEQNENDKFKELRISTIVLPSDMDKSKMPAAPVKSSESSTEAAAAKSTPDITKREIIFNSDTAIMAAIEQIIKQSSYLSEALKVIQSSEEQPDPQKQTEEVIENKNASRLKWYNLSAEVSNAKWDPKQSDFAYTITYVIQPYETPVIAASYINDAGSRYYGPHKRYDYWYTGKNSEILSYEQTMNNNYFNVALDPGIAGEAAKGGPANIPLIRKPKANTSQLGKLGAGNQAQNAVVTSLFDPGAYANARIKILGDPDFLMQESPGSVNQIYNQFYGTDGFTVNPNGGQVFIEIDFKEAEDYKIGNGLLSINESILFWKYPEKVSKIIKGVSYMVMRVTSNFENGKFTQDIEATLNTFPDDNAAGSETSSEAARETNNENTRLLNRAAANSNGPSTGSSNTTTTNTGFGQDPPPNTTNSTTGQTSIQSSQNVSQPTTQANNEAVADDDGFGVTGLPGA